MFAGINQVCSNYYNDLPSGMMKRVVVSAFTSFTITLLVLKKKDDVIVDMSRLLVNATIGAVASLIHGLSVPLFKKMEMQDMWPVIGCLKVAFVQVAVSALMNGLSSSHSLTQFKLVHGFALNYLIAGVSFLNPNSQKEEQLLYVIV